jgi:hypothetical protein
MQTETVRKIYRVADVQGRGMYAGTENAVSENLDTARHTTPQDDELFMYNLNKKSGSYCFSTEWYFGFKNLRQLLRWVGGEYELRDLRDNGFCIEVHYVYDKDYVEGNTQVIFRRENKIKTTKHSIAKVFKLKNKE